MTAVPAAPSSTTGLGELITALNGVKDQLVTLNRAPSGGGAGSGGPLGALTSIGGSWGKSAATLAAGMYIHQQSQGIYQGTAAQRGRYDPAGGAAMAAGSYDPYGPLKSIPLVGGLLTSMTDRTKEDMTRHASVLGAIQSNNMAAFSENNSLAEQTAGASVALNRQYSPAQADYQQRMIQPTMLAKKSKEWWAQKGELFDKAKAWQAAKADPNRAINPDTGEAMGYSARFEPGGISAFVEKGYAAAQKRYDVMDKGKKGQIATDKYVGTLEAQAAEAYKQATIGQYTPMEQANLGSVAIAAKLGGVPTLDTAVSDMEITNTTLLDIKNLIKGYMDGK